ncbi:MAG TPA: GxxExxY protein [Tepidisphaeraceae bacterium]|nr:GxxExxY protein [Tepidisphaeraceae bacterium]
MQPQINADQRRFNAITEAIIGCAYHVANELGVGFLEKVCENALALELRTSGWEVSQQHPVTVRYRDQVVGEYVADLVVAGATGFHICLLINFGRSRIEVRRIVREL